MFNWHRRRRRRRRRRHILQRRQHACATEVTKLTSELPNSSRHFHSFRDVTIVALNTNKNCARDSKRRRYMDGCTLCTTTPAVLAAAAATARIHACSNELSCSTSCLRFTSCDCSEWTAMRENESLADGWKESGTIPRARTAKGQSKH
jgi:hypothetical protein